MRFYLAILALLSLATPALAQTDDAYAPARAIVADIGKIVTPNGVQETFEVTLGGARQVVNVRGSDRDNPILIFVHGGPRSEEHTSELQSLMRISYAVFCLKKKKTQ